ncbi:conserved hypothetical protein [Hyphomicrobiales bacterium]|nr:conserved hypothetical protein [Hyphomicrobiales bacterium]CAH1673513.1 conserved hypothetical protein [Hyphomicrobiales bacterium]
MTCGPSCCARCRRSFAGDAPLPEPHAVEGEGAFTRKVNRSPRFAQADLWPIAVHEGGHAVVALLLGWAIGSRGVDIAQRFSANVARPPGATFAYEHVAVLAAGHTAERWLGRRIWRPESAYLRFYLTAARAGEARPCDNCRAFAALVQDRPDDDDEMVIALYRHFEKRAIDLVTSPRIFSAIRGVARELMQRSVMQDEDVRSLIPPDMLPGGCHAPMWTSMGYGEDVSRVALPRV